MAKTIVGSFDSFEEAHQVLRELQQNGFANDDISIIANNATGKYGPEGQLPRDAPATMSDTGANAATGAAAGGVLGGAAGLVVGLMGLAIPGVGPIVAAGPLAAALAGAGVGAIAGGLIGGLTGAGVPEDEAHVYAEAVRRGGALVTVRADEGRAEDAANIMRRFGAVDIERRAEMWREQGWERHDPAAEPYNVDQLERERTMYGGSDAGLAGRTTGGSAMGGSSMGGSSMGGSALGAAGGAAMQSPGYSSWNEHGEHFRMHHNENYGGSAFDEYEPAYRYGWESGNDTRYRGRSWSEIEPDMRRDWETRNPNGGWERFKAAVRRGWERTSDTVERAIPGDSDRDGR